MTAAEELLRWYDAERRDLPWRNSTEPWAVWVSESMLQQTRVETVVGYYRRFLDRFPSPRELAVADEAEALTLWSGLGYYRRVRQLRLAAQRVAELGEIPSTAAALQALPGIGPYTAAAIASIAFGEAVPVLDGNVLRVMARQLGCADEPSAMAVRRRLGAAAAKLLDPRRPGDSNQALMELGATLCLPRAPRCPTCPLLLGCRAQQAGAPERFPARRRRPERQRVDEVAAVAEREGRFFLVRRSDGAAQLPGLWEFPRAAGAGAGADDFARQLGGRWRLGAELARIRHAITRFDLRIVARAAHWQCDAVAESEGGFAEPGAEQGWFAPTGAQALPLTGVARKLLRVLERQRSESELAHLRQIATGHDVPGDELLVDLAQALGDQRAEDPQ